MYCWSMWKFIWWEWKILKIVVENTGYNLDNTFYLKVPEKLWERLSEAWGEQLFFSRWKKLVSYSKEMFLSGNYDEWDGLTFPDIFKTVNFFKQID